MISDNLKELLNNRDSSLQDILLDDSCLTAFKYNCNELVWYLVDRSEEVLNLAIYSTNPKIAFRANQLLSKEYHALIDDIIEKQIFVPTIEMYLKDKPTLPVMCKIANLTAICYEFAQNQFNCDFLINFIPYVSHRMILSLFETILEQVREPASISSLVDKTLQLISEFNEPFTSDMSDENAVQLAGLYKLCSLFRSKPILVEIVKKPENIKLLIRQFETVNVTVYDAEWECIDYYITSDNVEDVEPFFVSNILPLMSKSDPGLLHQYQVKLLHVTLTLAKYSENIRKILVEINFHVALHDIVALHPHHTLAHLAVTEFIIQASKMTEFEALILTQMLPFCEQILSNPNSFIELRAFAWDLICQFREWNKNDDSTNSFKESLAAFDETSSKKVDELSAIANAEYGGPLPEPSASADNFLENLSQQQIIQLLKLLMQKPK